MKWSKMRCGSDYRFDTEELPVKIAAEVKDFNAEDFMPKKLTREMDVFMQYGYAKQEWKQSQMPERKLLYRSAWVSSLARHLAVFHRLQKCRMD